MHLTSISALAGVFMALCVWTAHNHAPRIEAELDRRVEEILTPVPTLVQTLNGRDVTLAGRVHYQGESEAMQKAIDDLVSSIRAMRGVRTVRAEITIAPAAKPLTAGAFRDAGPRGS